MDLMLGLDVGTTATECLMLDPEGHVVASASSNSGLLEPREGWVEQQDPEELWRAVVDVCRSRTASLTPYLPHGHGDAAHAFGMTCARDDVRCRCAGVRWPRLGLVFGSLGGKALDDFGVA